ncbi:hypothetical protein RHSIM_Rhsim07G0103900 [Rhododendron simsii]|uniref:SAUR-like auxin-responsive protein family n=1 Tax=Rhododendron simsii TaxID=118357 RepID=A0A834LFR2_RHOSS|nr:hypothetical protein RHSIM_Rhsim07G0103900 [Rhododendron simsii]
MKKARGFRLGRKLVKILKSAVKRKTTKQYQRLTPPSSTTNTISRLCNWARGLCLPKSKSGYVRVGHDPIEATKPVGVPKGHLAVYVGEKEDDAHRHLVPVIYFNHPLFGDLLKDVEEKYGVDSKVRARKVCLPTGMLRLRLFKSAA